MDIKELTRLLSQLLSLRLLLRRLQGLREGTIKEAIQLLRQSQWLRLLLLLPLSIQEAMATREATLRPSPHQLPLSTRHQLRLPLSTQELTATIIIILRNSLHQRHLPHDSQ